MSMFVAGLASTPPDPMYDSIIVDVSLLAYRGWWACRELRTSTGVHTGLEYGFLNSFFSLVVKYRKCNPILAWDGRPSRCLTIYPYETLADGQVLGYKAQRSKSPEREEEPDWGPRFTRLREMLSSVVRCLYHPETEADEQIARYVYKQERSGKTTLIVSKDKDLHQLVSDKTHVLSQDDILDAEKITQLWGVPPAEIPFIRAISGDSSDNVKGVSRIPTKVKQRLASGTTCIGDLTAKINEASWLTKNQKEKLLEGIPLIERNYLLSELQSQRELEIDLLPPCEALGAPANYLQELELHSLLDHKAWDYLEWHATKNFVASLMKK